MTSVGENHPSTLFFWNWYETVFIHQHVKSTTRYRDNEIPSILELVFTKEISMLGEIEYSPPLDKSDHLVLIFTLTLYTEQEIRSGESILRPTSTP